jgi:beta-lactamase superfamily II metal-dependent hydrolase
MAAGDVTVSMYNVGFGDCFLIRFPGQNRERLVLVDCGSIKQGIVGATDVVVQQLIEDVTVDGLPRIDVIVVTHRHRDHVSGFASDLWRDVEVGEVWFPWTENPDDDEARELLDEMSSFAAALAAERVGLDGALGSDAERELLDHVLENTLGLSNEKAMNTLHRGFKGGVHGAKRRFLDRSTDVLACELLPDVSVHVLGPSRDRDVIRDMNPPSAESFIRAAAGGAGDHGDGDVLPFRPVEPLIGEPSDAVKDLLHRISRESALMGAVALEQAVNNTSLMLAFEVGDAVLLFPGDAQWGTWKLNLEDSRRKELLERTTFYKVGHHGSHNATPVSFVEDVLGTHNASPSGVWAAASVTPHGRFTEIPKPGLVTGLRARVMAPERVVRSDEPPASVPQGMKVLNRKRLPLRYDFTIASV